MKTRTWLSLLATASVLGSAGVLLAQEDDDDEVELGPRVDMQFELNESFASPAYGAASVTQGGAQDVHYARQLITEGHIPGPDALIVEGLLSEHDLPVAGPACAHLFCPLLASGYAGSFDSGRSEIWVQLGFNSNVDLATFRRRPLNIAIVLDRSGSMDGEKMEVVRAAALALLDELGPDDRLALVSYAETAEVDRTTRRVDDRTPFERDIRTWATGGATNMEAALDLGYREVARHAGDAGYENRVFVFTDMMPNVGMTGADSFAGMANRWAEESINLTVIGVGSDFGQELGLTLSELRGGNYYFLRDRAEAARTFGEELAFMVTPVAYDVEMTITPSPGFELTGVYGVPAADESGAITSEIKTLFLSRRGGAMVLRFVPSDAVGASWHPETPITHVQLAYTGVDDERQTAEATAYLALSTFEPEVPVFEQPSPYRAWALVQQSLIMRQSIADYHGGSAELARNRLSDLAGTLEAVATATGVAQMREEAALVRQLAANMH